MFLTVLQTGRKSENVTSHLWDLVMVICHNFDIVGFFSVILFTKQ